MALEEAQFVIVPGKVGDKLDAAVRAALYDVGPLARIIHEQWIKHCFMRESVVDPEHYNAKLEDNSQCSW